MKTSKTKRIVLCAAAILLICATAVLPAMAQSSDRAEIQPRTGEGMMENRSADDNSSNNGNGSKDTSNAAAPESGKMTLTTAA